MKYGLIGERLGHSYSKVIHGMLKDYEYELREVAPEELDGFMRAKDFLGINVTIPYKEAVIPYLDEIDESAEEIGAVNVVVNRNGKLCGYNTDFYGMKMLFSHAKVDANGKKAAILGSGGTSKTAAAVLRALGAKEIIKVSRSCRDGCITYDQLYKNHSDVEVIVNTTPVGMYPNITDSPVDVYAFENLTGVIDAVYNPLRTSIVQSAQICGAFSESGLYMLVCQAIRASEIFLGVNYPKDTAERIYDSLKKEKENIVLIGMPASGKSTVGRVVADRLGRKFQDTDELIVSRIGMPIKDYFAKEGEAAFRKIESQVISELATENSLVIATGGGAVMIDINQMNLSYNGCLYFIDRPLENLIPTESRPLAATRAAIEELYHSRYTVYYSVCDERIDADCDEQTVAQKITENYLK